jgi:hypothetical protein
MLRQVDRRFHGEVHPAFELSREARIAENLFAVPARELLQSESARASPRPREPKR